MRGPLVRRRRVTAEGTHWRSGVGEVERGGGRGRWGGGGGGSVTQYDVVSVGHGRRQSASAPSFSLYSIPYPNLGLQSPVAGGLLDVILAPPRVRGSKKPHTRADHLPVTSGQLTRKLATMPTHCYVPGHTDPPSFHPRVAATCRRPTDDYNPLLALLRAIWPLRAFLAWSSRSSYPDKPQPSLPAWTFIFQWPLLVGRLSSEHFSCCTITFLTCLKVWGLRRQPN